MHEGDVVSGITNSSVIFDVPRFQRNDSGSDMTHYHPTHTECTIHIGELYLLIIIGIETFFLAIAIGTSILLFLGKQRGRGEGIINQTFEEGEGDYIRPTEPHLRLYETILHFSPSRRSSRGTENPYEILNVNNNNNNNESIMTNVNENDTVNHIENNISVNHIENNISVNHIENNISALPVMVNHSREHSYDNIIESKENGSISTGFDSDE